MYTVYTVQCIKCILYTVYSVYSEHCTVYKVYSVNSVQGMSADMEKEVKSIYKSTISLLRWLNINFWTIAHFLGATQIMVIVLIIVWMWALKIYHKIKKQEEEKTSLLRRLQAQTLPNEAPPEGKIRLFRKIAVTFEPIQQFWCPSRFRISEKMSM